MILARMGAGPRGEGNIPLPAGREKPPHPLHGAGAAPIAASSAALSGGLWGRAAAGAASADRQGLSCLHAHISGALGQSTPARQQAELPKGLPSSNPKPLSLH